MKRQKIEDDDEEEKLKEEEGAYMCVCVRFVSCVSLFALVLWNFLRCRNWRERFGVFVLKNGTRSPQKWDLPRKHAFKRYNHKMHVSNHFLRPLA